MVVHCLTDFLFLLLQEDGRKPAASTYLIDQIDYPFEYCGFEMQHQHNHQHPGHPHPHPHPHPHHHIGNNTLKPPHTDSVNSVNTGTLRKHQPNYNNHNSGGKPVNITVLCHSLCTCAAKGDLFMSLFSCRCPTRG